MLYSDQEIIRRLRAIRYSPAGERNAGRAPSMNAIVEASGLTVQRIYQIVREGHFGAVARLKLNQAFSAIDSQPERTRGRAGYKTQFGA